VQSDSLINAATDHVVRARLLAAYSPGSGDWLEALPLSSVELKMDNTHMDSSVGSVLSSFIFSLCAIEYRTWRVVRPISFIAVLYSINE